MSTNEKDEFDNKVGDGSDAMDVDSLNVGEKLPLGQEEDRADNSQKMEMGEERPLVSHDENEDLDAKKEENKNSVKIEMGDGENHDANEDLDSKKEECKNSVVIEKGDGENHDVNNNSVGDLRGEAEADCLVDGVSNHSLEEKGSDEVSLPNESKKDESQCLEIQREGSVLAEERDENLQESSNVGKRMEDLSQDVYKKDENLNDGAGGLKASVKNGTKMEELSNELTSMNGSKEDELKREVEIAKFEEPKKELTKRELMDTSLVVHDKTKESASHVKEKLRKPVFHRANETDARTPPPVRSFLGDPNVDGYDSGTEEEQREFSREIHVFHKERGIDFKPPKFYQEQLNILKLWRWVIKLGGYEQVTSCKLWRDVGESFRPPKTCTTVSWTFRGFYEKTLLEYEKQKILSGELPEIGSSSTNSMVPGTQGTVSQPSGSGRARRDAASRAMQGWHALRVSSNGEAGDPIIKDKHTTSLGKHERQLKNIALTKRIKQSPIEHAARVGHLKSPNPQSETMVVDAGPPAEWVKINVHRTKDCYEVYALVPGLLREEVRVQSDPAGRLVISGQPEHLDNPWGVTPFKKVVTLPTRIDPHQTSAVVTLHGQLFVRVPFEQSDN